MALRTFIPSPYTVDVYPNVEQAANSQGNKTTRNATEPVQRQLQSIHVWETREKIDPAFVNRVITSIRVMTATPREWREGDELVIENMGRYRVVADPAPRDMGPLVQYNYLMGGKIFAKRVA